MSKFVLTSFLYFDIFYSSFNTTDFELGVSISIIANCFAVMLIHCTQPSAEFIIAKEVVKLDAEILAVKYLGTALIFLIIGIVLCFLASLSYNTYVKFQDRHKKIEVRTKNSNQVKRHE